MLADGEIWIIFPLGLVCDPLSNTHFTSSSNCQNVRVLQSKNVFRCFFLCSGDKFFSSLFYFQIFKKMNPTLWNSKRKSWTQKAVITQVDESTHGSKVEALNVFTLQDVFLAWILNDIISFYTNWSNFTFVNSICVLDKSLLAGK